jgi:hypothetical protein
VVTGALGWVVGIRTLLRLLEAREESGLRSSCPSHEGMLASPWRVGSFWEPRKPFHLSTTLYTLDTGCPSPSSHSESGLQLQHGGVYVLQRLEFPPSVQCSPLRKRYLPPSLVSCLLRQSTDSALWGRRVVLCKNTPALIITMA